MDIALRIIDAETDDVRIIDAETDDGRIIDAETEDVRIIDAESNETDQAAEADLAKEPIRSISPPVRRSQKTKSKLDKLLVNMDKLDMGPGSERILFRSPSGRKQSNVHSSDQVTKRMGMDIDTLIHLQELEFQRAMDEAELGYGNDPADRYTPGLLPIVPGTGAGAGREPHSKAGPGRVSPAPSPTASDVANHPAVKAVIKFQAILRRQWARKDLVLLMQNQQCLLAMPGTVQGRSGWYEYDDGGEAR